MNRIRYRIFLNCTWLEVRHHTLKLHLCNTDDDVSRILTLDFDVYIFGQ